MRKNERRFKKKVGDILLYIFFVIEYDRGVYDIVWWLVGFGVYRFFFFGVCDG